MPHTSTHTPVCTNRNVCSYKSTCTARVKWTPQLVLMAYRMSDSDYPIYPSRLFIGPIPLGHSSPLCHALSLTSHAACATVIAGVRQQRHLVNGNVTAARSGEWAQHFSNASCSYTNISSSPLRSTLAKPSYLYLCHGWLMLELHWSDLLWMHNRSDQWRLSLSISSYSSTPKLDIYSPSFCGIVGPICRMR